MTWYAPLLRAAGLALAITTPAVVALLAPVLVAPAAARGEEQAKTPAVLVVAVPADAELTISGYRSKQTGAERRFQTPPLGKGKFVYQVTAAWTLNGKRVRETQDVTVTAGETVEVLLGRNPKPADEPAPPPAETKPPAEPKPPVKPAPATTPPDTPAKPKPASLSPYVPTPDEVVDKMLDLADVKQTDIVYDIGCGDGRIVITAAKKFKATGVGIDVDPARVKESRANALREDVADLVKFREEDALKVSDLNKATVVTLYLLEESNKLLQPVLKAQLKNGTRVVSHNFRLGDWRPNKTVMVKDKEGVAHTLFLWVVGEAAPADEPKPAPKPAAKTPADEPEKPAGAKKPDDSKKDDPKKDDPKKDDPKKDDPKKDDPKKEDAKKDDPRKDDPKKDDPKTLVKSPAPADEPKRAAQKPANEMKTTSQERPAPEKAKDPVTKPDAGNETAKVETVKPETVRPERPKPATKPESAKPETIKPDTKPESAKPESVKPDPKPAAGIPPKPGPKADDPVPTREPDIFFVATPAFVVDKMIEVAEVKADDVVYDLGSGDGRILIAAAKLRGARGVGIEIDPKWVKNSRASVKKADLDRLVTIRHADFFSADFSDATVVMLYLHPDLNARLMPLLAKLKPGTRVVSHDFAMKGAKPTKTVPVSGETEQDKHTIYLWTVPFDKE